MEISKIQTINEKKISDYSEDEVRNSMRDIFINDIGKSPIELELNILFFVSEEAKTQEEILILKGNKDKLVKIFNKLLNNFKYLKRVGDYYKMRNAYRDAVLIHLKQKEEELNKALQEERLKKEYEAQAS